VTGRTLTTADMRSRSASNTGACPVSRWPTARRARPRRARRRRLENTTGDPRTTGSDAAAHVNPASRMTAAAGRKIVATAAQPTAVPISPPSAQIRSVGASEGAPLVPASTTT
jgi:hypothetical protein